MNTKLMDKEIGPPGLIKAITTGFNTVANHIYLILFPIALDVLLWFGPQLRIKNLLEPLLNESEAAAVQISGAEMTELIKATREIWQEGLAHFNLISSLRAFPIGIPSLMAASGPLENPVGSPAAFQIETLGGMVSAWVVLSLAGLMLGSYFFNLISRQATTEKRSYSIGTLGWQTLQSVVLVVVLIAVVLVVVTPVIILTSALALISPVLSQLALLISSFILIWLLLPLIFSPHGIFILQLSALRSTLLSYRLVRFFLPGAGLFVMVSILISQGLDVIWRVAPEQSWMALVGVIGHAFVSTALVAASFIYYSGGVRWMQERLKKTQ